MTVAIALSSVLSALVLVGLVLPSITSPTVPSASGYRPSVPTTRRWSGRAASTDGGYSSVGSSPPGSASSSTA